MECLVENMECKLTNNRGNDLMKFCADCGSPLREGESHECNISTVENTTAAETAVTAVALSPKFTLDGKLFLRLLKNPDNSMRLHPEKDFLYGIIGILLSIAGFFMWALALQKHIQDSLSSILGVFDLFDRSTKGISIAPNLLWLGLASILSLIGVLWGVGNWAGYRKYSLKEITTYLGAMQITSGVGFLVAAAFLFISYQLSILLVIFNLLITFVMTIMGAHDMYRINSDRRLQLIALTVGCYLILVSVISLLLV